MKRLILCMLVAWTFLSPAVLVGVVALEQAAAADPQCLSGAIVAFDRRRNCGYFKNEYKTSGQDVRIGGVPGSVNTAARFIQLVEGDLTSGNAQRMTGAKFIILNMIDRPAGLPQSVTAAELQDWKDRVNSYASSSENGSSSFGPNGRIDWFVSLHTPCGTVNTYYQVAEDDVAPFTNTPTNGSNCHIPSSRSNFILFRDTSGSIKYMIRRECMNPMGNLENGIDKPKALNYNVDPSIVTEVNGDSSTAAAEVGDSVRFIYQATNTGIDPSPNVSCTIYANVHSGYFAAPPTPTSGNNPAGYVPPPTSCPKVFNPGLGQVATETITITTANQTICRSLFVSPSSPTVSSLGKEVCIPIANKPYARVFGGDVSAGNDLAVTPGACTPNSNAAVVGWSKRSTGNFAGAGAQFGVYALSAIQDFASALGSPASANAQAPDGLSFANTSTNPSIGTYGGNFGQVPCIPNYYATKPDITLPLPPSFTAMVTGSYEATGTTTITGGIVDRNERIALFVDGDLFINGNITYAAGTWTFAETPTLRLIVRGNIYVGRTVTQLDGLFVAQKMNASTGNFYTCATGASALPLNGALYNLCNSKLTINGAVVADRLHLLRTVGTLAQSNPSESSTANAASEVFNYSPAHWLRQPLEPAPTPGYDAIISLPPIL